MKLDNNKLKVDLFTTQFSQLINELITLYPSDNSLTLLQSVTNGMIFMNPTSFVKTTIDYLKPYNEKILLKDESFFLNEIIADFDNHSFIADEIKKVHTIWIDPNTSETTKQSIWKYFIFMIKLGKSIKF